jgi:hypothetical protein
MLLTLADARSHITTALGDEAFQLLLDAAEAEITDAIGPVGNVSEVLTTGSGDLIMLSRRASAIVSVNERTIDLDPTDYELAGSGRMLLRLDTGPSPARSWWGRVVVISTPVSDVWQRQVAQVALCQLALDTVAGGSTTQERIGDWSESFGTSAETRARRNDILAGLSSRLVLL